MRPVQFQGLQDSIMHMRISTPYVAEGLYEAKVFDTIDDVAGTSAGAAAVPRLFAISAAKVGRCMHVFGRR